MAKICSRCINAKQGLFSRSSVRQSGSETRNCWCKSRICRTTIYCSSRQSSRTGRHDTKIMFVRLHMRKPIKKLWKILVTEAALCYTPINWTLRNGLNLIKRVKPGETGWTLQNGGHGYEYEDVPVGTRTEELCHAGRQSWNHNASAWLSETAEEPWHSDEIILPHQTVSLYTL